jgi:hypothetical protein
MTGRVATANLNIDPELCKRLDYFQHGSHADDSKRARYDLYHRELWDRLNELNPEVAARNKTAGLYRLCTWIQRIQSDQKRKKPNA